MSLIGRLVDRIVVKNMSSSVKIHLRTDFKVDDYEYEEAEDLDSRKSYIIWDFLTGISSVRHMIISLPTLEDVSSYSWVDLTNDYVPQCLTSTLEYVRIKDLYSEEETWINLVNYFLENSAILKKLILSFEDYHPMSINDSDIIMKLLTSTKLSSNCQVFIE